MPNCVCSWAFFFVDLLLLGLDVHLPVEHPAAELQEPGAESLAAPALQGGLADSPAGGLLFLVQVDDFHLRLLPK